MVGTPASSQELITISSAEEFSDELSEDSRHPAVLRACVQSKFRQV
jgi:hypothetical protein